MPDRRRDERHSLDKSKGDCQDRGAACFEVVDTDTGQSLGHLEDISAHGVCLQTSIQLDTRKAMSVTVKFPVAIEGRRELSLHVRSLWCSHDEVTGMFLTGCHVVNLPTSEIDVYENLLEYIAQQARTTMAETLR